MESDARGAGGGVESEKGGSKECHARLLQRRIEDVEERAARCHQAGELALKDCRVAGEELFCVSASTFLLLKG